MFGEYTGEVTVSLPSARFVYDMKGRKDFPLASKFRTALRANRAAWFALLPGRSLRPQVELPSAVLQRGSTVSAAVRIPNAPGKHAVKIRAMTPAGKHADWLDQTLIVGSVPAPLTLPLAYNDPGGKWQMRATDLFGNQAAKAKLRVW